MKPTTSLKYSKSVSPSPAVCARRSLLRRIQRQELRKLRSLVPATRRCGRSVNEPVDIIYDAIRYIDQLHNTVIARIQAGNLSPDTVHNFGLNMQFIQDQAQVRRPSSTPQTAPTRISPPSPFAPGVPPTRISPPSPFAPGVPPQRDLRRISTKHIKKLVRSDK